ncbi:MAG: CpaF family protein [Lachnospiraceae bacterium]|nr:CpaF family protein [Lachnospiraceae bacterium]
MALEEAFQIIEKRLFDSIDVAMDIDDDAIMDRIQEEICDYARENPLDVEERIKLQKELFYSLRKYDVLSELLEDEDITEIMINGFNHIFIEKRGKVSETKWHFSSKEKLDDVIQQIVGANNQVINETTPIVDTRLADGSRVNIVLPPIAIDGSAMSIRRFSKEPITLSKLIELHSINEEIKEFLGKLITAKYNIFISGGTGSGKTTFLNALTEYVPEDERVITIEDAAELQVIGINNLVRLEARRENIEGDLEVTIRDLVRTSLRMRPNRIIVGECRGAEAIEVLQACNTGHDGSLSTGHANSSIDMISRLETMVLQGMELPVMAIRKQIASAIDIFIHLGRLPNGERKLLEISEVIGVEGEDIKLNKLYEFDYESKGSDSRWLKRNNLQNTEKLLRVQE